MSAALFVSLLILGWVCLLAVILVIFHAWEAADDALQREMNAIFSVRGGTRSAQDGDKTGRRSR